METTNSNDDLLAELTAEVVAAYVSNNNVETSDLSKLISDVHSALGRTTATQSTESLEKQKPAVSVRKSIKDDQLVCLECGQSFKSLKRHLKTHHAIAPQEYRDKWGLPSDYPMVAPEYAKARSRLAKEMGLGHKRKISE